MPCLINCCSKDLQIEANPWTIAGMLAYCSSAAIGTWWQHWGVKGGEDRNWAPYLSLPAPQDMCPL